MTVGLAGVCFIVAAILFAISAWPPASDYRLERIGFVFLALGHVLP